MRRYLLLLVSLLICHLSFAQYINVIDPELQTLMNSKDKDKISVNIIFKSQLDLYDLNVRNSFSDKKSKREYFLNELQYFSKKNQEDVLATLQVNERSNQVSNIKSHWLVNMITCETTADVIYKLSEHPDVAAIAYNKHQPLLFDEKSDKTAPVRGKVENISKINADDVWDLGFTGKGVIVSLLDTGVNINHVDLKDHLWDGGEAYPNHGYNTFSDSHNISDDDGHGTHCAGTICGDGTSGTQTGIAPDATLMCIKVFGYDEDGEWGGTASSIISGVEFSVENGADILSLSLGFTYPNVYVDNIMREVFENTLLMDVVASVAAGNDGRDLDKYPVPRNINSPGNCPPPWLHPDQQVNSGRFTSVVCVGAVDYNDVVADFSSIGPVTWTQSGSDYNDYPYSNSKIGLIRPDICAPGVDIYSCSHKYNNGFTYMSGTSMATPCVAGAMALLLEKDPTLTPASICQALESSAVQLTSNKSNVTGSGRIDVMNAIKFLNEEGPALPLIKFKSCSPIEITTGKNIMITVTLENQGTAPNKNDFILTLTSDDEYITIENNTANFGIINPGATSKATFTIRAKNTTPDQHIINFRLSGEDISTVLNSKTYNFNEGGDGWTTIDANKDGHTWYHSSQVSEHNSKSETDHYIISESYCNATGTAISPDDYAVMPFKASICKDTYIEFLARAEDAEYPNDYFGLAISLNGKTSADDFETVVAWEMEAKTPGNIYRCSHNLSNYAGQEIWIAIRHYNCRDEFRISVDDFTIANYQTTSKTVWDTIFSISVSNGCDAPKNLKADIINQNSIKLSWSKSSTAKKYELYRNDEKITETTNTSYTDKDINVNTDYCYIVKSVCNLGLSDPSNEACTSILEEDNTDNINEIVSSFNLYPNPVEDELHLEADGIIEEVIIYNINGQQTIINSIQTPSTHSVINVSNLNPGIYFIKINETMNKFIKK